MKPHIKKRLEIGKNEFYIESWVQKTCKLIGLEITLEAQTPRTLFSIYYCQFDMRIALLKHAFTLIVGFTRETK
jgi:hypothetical protein